MRDFFSEQQLMTMPLGVVRGLDIETKDQERLVQKVVNSRLASLPPSAPISRRDVPDIENQEQEMEWQAKIDARMAKLKAPLMEDETPVDAPPADGPEAPQEPTPSQPTMRMRETDMAQATGEGKPVLLKTPKMGTVGKRKK